MQQAPGIVQDADGTYHWVFEFRLMRNPVIFLTILKIFVAVGCAIIGVGMLLSLARGAMSMAVLTELLQTLGLITAIFFCLTTVGYVIYAAQQGWKYCVHFEMDERGVTHTQLPRQYEKAQVMGALTALVGAAAGSPTTMGAGILSASRQSISSDFELVRSIRVYNFWRVMKVNQPLAKNQVYADAADWPFVRGYILERCPQAKVKGRVR